MLELPVSVILKYVAIVCVLYLHGSSLAPGFLLEHVQLGYHRGCFDVHGNRPASIRKELSIKSSEEEKKEENYIYMLKAEDAIALTDGI